MLFALTFSSFFAVDLQAMDRAHRIGAKKPVQVSLKDEFEVLSMDKLPVLVSPRLGSSGVSIRHGGYH